MGEDWKQRFRALFNEGVERHKAGRQSPDAMFEEAEIEFLESIGCSSQEMFDFCDDYVCWDDVIYDHVEELQAVRYEYWRGAKPSTYYTHASFDDYLGFLEHQVSSHHERLAADLRDVIADLRIEWVDPVGGASTLTTTDHQEPPATAGELATAYAERMPANPAPWWLALRTAGGEAE